TGAAIFRRGRIGQGGHALKSIGDVDIESLAADANVVDILAIHHEVVAARARSVDLNLIEVAADAAQPEVLVHDLDAGYGLQQFDRIQCDDGNICELRGADGAR